jgi:hypothetical protein
MNTWFIKLADLQLFYMVKHYIDQYYVKQLE